MNNPAIINPFFMFQSYNPAILNQFYQHSISLPFIDYPGQVYETTVLGYAYRFAAVINNYPNWSSAPSDAWLLSHTSGYSGTLNFNYSNNINSIPTGILTSGLSSPFSGGNFTYYSVGEALPSNLTGVQLIYYYLDKTSFSVSGHTGQIISII
jgi:hypothetical protein